tara:strand:+ start:2221 stop:2619 length:399 start_codon:yes stop_codon:yes gene_type:complete
MIWLLGVAMANEPPARPEPHNSQKGDCEETSPITDEMTLLCTALAVPPADLADLLADREWAFLLRDTYRIDTAQLEAEKANLQWQIDYLQSELTRARYPPLKERPGFWLGVGTAAGLGLTIGSAWAVGQVAP